MQQTLVSQHAMIVVDRDEDPMALIPDGRGRGWIADQSAHQRHEIGRIRGRHLGGQASTAGTRSAGVTQYSFPRNGLV
jgi:hypothetical protein